MEQPFPGAGDVADARAMRCEPRDSLFLSAIVARQGGGEQVQARVRDLSGGGMMAECGLAFQPGDRLEIELRGVGVVAGRVAWSNEGRIGVAFDRRIDPALARRPLQAAQQPMLVRAAVSARRPGLTAPVSFVPLPRKFR